LGFKVIQNHRC